MNPSNPHDGEDQTAMDDFQATIDTYWAHIRGILDGASQLAAEGSGEGPFQPQTGTPESRRSITSNESHQPAQQQRRDREGGPSPEDHRARLPQSGATNDPTAGDDYDLFEDLLRLGATSHQQTNDHDVFDFNSHLQNGEIDRPKAEGDDDLRGEEHPRDGAVDHEEADDGNINEDNGFSTSIANGNGLHQAEARHESNGNVLTNGARERMHALLPNSRNSHNHAAAQATASAVLTNGSVPHNNATTQAPAGGPTRRALKFDMNTADAHINQIRHMLDPAVRLAAADHPTRARMAQEVRDLMEAMTDRASAVDVTMTPIVGGRAKIRGPFAYKRYAQDNLTTDDDLEAWCWRLYSVVLDLHMMGTPISAERMNRVTTKRSLAANLALSFQQRLAAIRDVLRTRKTTWADVEEGSFRLEILVLCPLATADRKEGNKKNNDSKGAKLSRVAAIDQAEREFEAGTSDTTSTPNTGSNAPAMPMTPMTPMTPASIAGSKRSPSLDTEADGDSQRGAKRVRLEGTAPASTTAEANPRPRKRSVPADEDDDNEAYGNPGQGNLKRRKGPVATGNGRIVHPAGAENSSTVLFQGVASGFFPALMSAAGPIGPRIFTQGPGPSNVTGSSDQRVNGTSRNGHGDCVRSNTPPGVPANMIQRHNDSDTIRAPQTTSRTPAGTITPAATPPALGAGNTIDDQVRRFLPDYNPARTTGDLNHGGSNA